VFLYILVQEKMKGGGADVGTDNNDFCRLLGEKLLDPGTQRDQSEREACSAAESFEVGTSHRASTIEKACEAGQLLVDLGPMSMSMPMSPGKQMRWVQPKLFIRERLQCPVPNRCHGSAHLG
jgi:hypothetical protein